MDRARATECPHMQHVRSPYTCTYRPTDSEYRYRYRGTGVQGPSLSTTDTDYYRLDVTDKHAMIDRIGRSSRRQTVRQTDTDTAGLPSQENMHSVATVAVPIHLVCELPVQGHS